MKKKRTSFLSSQAGKIEPALITAVIVAVIGVILGKYTGMKVLVYTVSSGIIRLVIGGLCAVYVSLWWGMKLHDVFSFGVMGTQLVVYSLLVSVLFAVVLIPLGTIQIIGTILKMKNSGQKKPISTHGVFFV